MECKETTFDLEYKTNVLDNIKNDKKSLSDIRWELYHYLIAITNDSLRKHFASLPEKAFDQIKRHKDNMIVYRKATSEVVKNILDDDHLARIVLAILEKEAKTQKTKTI